ncbi:MAG TPA: DUF3108 domain-containing protein [Bacteroidales bacterium]|nr:DUF3108 domain-containing protein [Bacteroidales bacterium]
MRRIFYLTVLVFLCSGQIFSQKNMVYGPGEKVNYNIHYGVITGGVATIEIKHDTLFGKRIYHSRLEARTTGLTDAIFRVLDVYESYIDPSTELPVKSIRNIREGRYRKYNEVLFDHKTRRDSAILTSDLTGIHITEQGIHDILSCFYWFRSRILPDKTMEKGEMITIMTWFTDELYPIRLRYMGTDEVKTKLGKIHCYKFNPVTEAGRLFSTDEGVSFWFSADKNFLPVKIRFDIFVGSFEVEMSEYEGLLYPLEIKKK